MNRVQLHAHKHFSFCLAIWNRIPHNRASHNILTWDNDKDACETYAANLGKEAIWCADLSNIRPLELLERSRLNLSEIDLIVGGPPCQGFSSAGAKDWTDPRNILLRNFVEIVTDLRPTWFVMENVEGLLTANDGIFLIEAVTRFLEAGYWVRAKKVYMERYGLPQRRKRVVIVGNLEHCSFDFPEALSYQYPALPLLEQYPQLTILDAVSDLPQPSVSGEVFYSRTPQNAYQNSLRRIDNQPVLHHTAKPLNNFSQQRVNLADQPSLTITSASPTEFIQPTENRPLTLRECARIQSFPDWYEFAGSYSSIATQIGNAFPPLFMQLLAAHRREVATWQRVENSRGCWLGIDATKSGGMSPALMKMLAGLQEKTYTSAHTR